MALLLTERGGLIGLAPEHSPHLATGYRTTTYLRWLIITFKKPSRGRVEESVVYRTHQIAGRSADRRRFTCASSQQTFHLFTSPKLSPNISFSFQPAPVLSRIRCPRLYARKACGIPKSDEFVWLIWAADPHVALGAEAAEHWELWFRAPCADRH